MARKVSERWQEFLATALFHGCTERKVCPVAVFLAGALTMSIVFELLLLLP